MVHIGDKVKRKPVTFNGEIGSMERKILTGTVIYIHPLHRYHVVAFGEGRRAVRESFHGVRTEMAE